MSISTEEVEKIAKLARLEFNEEEKQKLQLELSEILNYVDQLKEITEKVDLNADADLNGMNLVREDEAVKVSNPEEFLNQAPQTQDGFVKVKSVLE